MYSIQEVAKVAGTTSRALRHYDRVGILPPSSIGRNGYRYYDERSLVRLQRILLLRELGLGLDAIGEVLSAQDAQAGADERPARAEAQILRTHLELLQQEQRRIDAQIGAVERTIDSLEEAADSAGSHATKEGDLMSRNMFEGFDHTRYREEVEQRWGADAYRRSDRWWRGLGEEGRVEWQAKVAQLSADWVAAAEHGEDPEGETARGLARRHVDGLAEGPGRPGDLEAYVTGLAEMYVADERFAANYGGEAGATFVRDALLAYVRRGTDG